MRIETMPGTTNVVLFPLERRAPPTLELMRELAPDPRVVFGTAEAFDLDPPPDGLRQRVDAETAEWILNQVPARPGPEREAALAQLLGPLVGRAVAACRASGDAWDAAEAAQESVLAAQAAGRRAVAAHAGRAGALARAAAELRVFAYARCQEAEGAARAVSFARRGRSWKPFDPRAEERALFGDVLAAV